MAQFSRIAGVAASTAASLRDKGKLNVIKVGGQYRITRREVERYLSEYGRGRRQ